MKTLTCPSHVENGSCPTCEYARELAVFVLDEARNTILREITEIREGSQKGTLIGGLERAAAILRRFEPGILD
jgi:hypothetical protein